MSKNISIKEGGVSKTYTATKLTTNLVGGGTCNWIPDDSMSDATATARDITAGRTAYVGANKITGTRAVDILEVVQL